MADAAVLVGRLLLAALFAAGTWQKLDDPAPTYALLSDRGLPGTLFWPALGANAFGAAALALGYAARPVAAVLALYCMATSVFHLVPDDPWQMSIFVKNWAIAGGLLVLAAHGPGRYALRP
ncbi:MAG: DoxX family protein [Rhodobacteraceae bacterium]|nr:DoxX family protein [Paracoccaceae bacterium]